MENSKRITLLATMTARPGEADRLGAMLGTLAESSRKEPGCITYNAHRSNRDRNSWIVYENWRSQQDLDAHMKTPEFVKFAAELPKVLAGEMDLHFLTMLGEPTPAR